MGPVIEVDCRRTAELFAARMTDNSVISMSLRYGFEDPVVLGIIPHRHHEARSEDLRVCGTVCRTGCSTRVPYFGWHGGKAYVNAWVQELNR